MWLILIAGASGGLVVGYMVVAGTWQFATLLLFALPALIIIHRHPFATVIVWLALMPFLLHTETASSRYIYWAIHRGLPLLTVGMIFLSSGLGVERRRLPRLGLPEVAMGGYVLMSVLSILLQNNQPQATLYLFYDRIIVAMLLYLIVRLAGPQEREMRWLLGVAVFVVLSQSLIGIASQFAPSALPSSWMENAGSRTVGTLINAAIYTIALMFGSLILLHAAQQSRARWQRWLFVLCFLLAAYCTFISFSRASWLAGLLVGVALCFVYPRSMIKLVAIMAPITLLLGGVVLVDQLDWARERLYSDEAENSATSRLPIMVGAYNMFQEKPLTGWGYGNFDLYDRSFYGRLLDISGDNRDHASHNYFLSILAEQGLVGLLLYLLPMFVWFVATLRQYPNLPVRGLQSRNLIVMLWLVILFHIVVSNFINMIVVYGLGVWWITLGLIGHLVQVLQVPAKAPLSASSSWAGKDQLFVEENFWR
jgi:O-antigen ligase